MYFKLKGKSTSNFSGKLINYKYIYKYFEYI